MFSFGENELYTQVDVTNASLLKRAQMAVIRTVGFAMPIINGRGVFQYSFGLLPRRQRCVTVVGTPMQVPRVEEPTAEQVDEWHGKYCEALQALFERHKGEFGGDDYAGKKLQFV